MKIIVGFALLIFGCATTSNRASLVPEDGRARWIACHPAIDEYCHAQGHGDPMIETQCERRAAEEYSAQANEEARESYLTAHGCRVPR